MESMKGDNMENLLPLSETEILLLDFCRHVKEKPVQERKSIMKEFRQMGINNDVSENVLNFVDELEKMLVNE